MPKHTSSIVVVDDGEALAGCYATLLDAIRRNRAARLAAQRKTEPVGDIVQPDFLNAAVEVRSDLTPPEMLKRLKETELRVGRTPGERWGQREIDLDLLFVGDLVVTGERMKVPHPEARNRKFVLIPLAEIASSFPDPLTGRRISDLLQSCTDTKRVTRISESIDV